MPAAPAVWWHWEHIPDDDEDPEAEDPSPEALLDPGDLGRPDGDDGEAPPPTSLEDMARASEHWRHWIRLFVPSRRRLNEVAFFTPPPFLSSYPWCEYLVGVAASASAPPHLLLHEGPYRTFSSSCPPCVIRACLLLLHPLPPLCFMPSRRRSLLRSSSSWPTTTERAPSQNPLFPRLPPNSFPPSSSSLSRSRTWFSFPKEEAKEEEEAATEEEENAVSLPPFFFER